jgi:uncharacterized protein YqhQ
VRSPTQWSVAIRKPDGSIHVECDVGEDRWPKLRKTILRGPLQLIESVSIGMRAMRIAVRETSGSDVGAETMVALFVPVLLGVLGVFIALPGVVATAFDDPLGDIVEAAGRAAMLLLYLAALGGSEQSQRMFRYHGAEHMVIAAFERLGHAPTIEQARDESPIHVRCGTDFIAIFVIVCGVGFSFVGRESVWVAGLLRVALVPVAAAVAYEVMRLCARWPRSVWARLLTWPGRALQRVTTSRPDDPQLEVALSALQATVGPNGGPGPR